MKEEDISKLLDGKRGLNVQVEAACDTVKKYRDGRISQVELENLNITHPGLLDYVVHINRILNDANEIKSEKDFDSVPFQRLYDKHMTNQITMVEYEVLNRFYPSVFVLLKKYEKLQDKKQDLKEEEIVLPDKKTKVTKNGPKLRFEPFDPKLEVTELPRHTKSKNGPTLKFVPNEEKKDNKKVIITPEINLSDEKRMNEIAKEGFRKRYGHTFEQVLSGQIPEDELGENERKHAELIKWEDDRIKKIKKEKSKKKETKKQKPIETPKPKIEKKPAPKPIMPKQKPENSKPENNKPEIKAASPEPKEERIRTLGEIIAFIEKDMPIERKDDNSYEELKASNIKVKDIVKNELHSDNVKYNVSRVVRTALTATITGVRKAYLKVFKLKNLDTIEEMKKRVESLSEDELQVVYEGLTGSRRNTYGYMSGITDSLLEERIESWLNAKANKLAVINEELYGKLIDDYARIKEIDMLLAGNKLTKEDEIRLTKERVELTKGKAKQVKNFEDRNIEINRILSSGVLGFKDDKRAMTIGKGLNQVGYRDATKGEYNPEVVQNVSQLDRKIDELIKLGDDELALKALMYRERYLVQNTKFEKKWFGWVSTGPIVYDPVSHPIDRRQDTFVRDALITAAAVTSIVSAANSIHTFLENKAAMAHNESLYGKAQSDVTDSAKAIYGQQEHFAEGNRSIAEAMRGFEQGTHERISGTRASGGDGLVISGPTYNASDQAFHLQEVTGLKEFQKGYNGLMDKFQAGTVDGTEFIRESFDLAKQSMTSFQGEMDKFLPMLRQYQSNNG